MLTKLLSMFKSPKTKETTSQVIKKQPSKPRRKVESTRIGELGEHKIDIQLDQLPKNYKSLSDLLVKNQKSRTGYSQIDHLVITPYCIFVIETKNYNGEIKGGRSDQQWTVSNRYKVYNPLKQNYGHIKAIENLLTDIPGERFVSMVSFTMRCRFSIDPELRNIGSDELVIYDVELSEFISRKLLRLKAENAVESYSQEIIQEIHQRLLQANITDPEVRKLHVEKIAAKKG